MLALYGCAARGVWMHRQQTPPPALWVTLGALVATLALRLWLYTPSLIHSEMVGHSLLSEIYDFPLPAVFKGAYGQVSFLLLGLVTEGYGERVEVVFAANQVFGVAALGLCAWAVARWCQNAWAAPVVVAFGALQPYLARVGASEDAHNIALLFGWAAVVAADIFRERHGRLALLAAALATALAIESRQTMYPWAFLVLFLLFARPGAIRLAKPTVALGAGIILLALIARFAVNTGDGQQATTYKLLADIMGVMGVLSEAAKAHFFLHPWRYGPLTALFALGGLWSLRRRPALAFGIGVITLGYFLVTLPSVHRNPGDELAVRLPMTMLVFAFAGAGAFAFVQTVAQRAHAAAAGAVALGLLTSPAWFPGFTERNEQSLATVEYLFLRDAAAQLPHALSVLVLPQFGQANPHPIPRLPLIEGGASVSATPPGWLKPKMLQDEVVIFYPGLRCLAWDGRELIGDGSRRTKPPLLWRVVEASARGELLPETRAIPKGLRPECRPYVEASETIGPKLTVPTLPPEIPMMVFADGPHTLQLYRMRRLPDTTGAPPIDQRNLGELSADH